MEIPEKRMNLYRDDWKQTYTDEATTLDMKISQLVRPVYEEYIGYGYKPRELAQVIEASITMLMLESLLSYNAKK